MTKANQLKADLLAGGYENTFRLLYQDVPGAVRRYCSLVDTFVDTYGDGELQLFSAPGRTEVGGNHTDHQHGRVLAAAVDLDIIAVVRRCQEPRIRILSTGYGEIAVDLTELSPHTEERETSASLVRGMAACFTEQGLTVSGFDACLDSQVFAGSGLSSSAAFETLIGVILRELGGARLSNQEIAQLAQRAENHWFGKPCGLMDQMACAVGGFIAIDFSKPGRPLVEQVAFDFGAVKTALCITGPIGSHEDLTPAYAAIPQEMGLVAQTLGKQFLGEIEPAEFYAALPDLLKQCPDRALLRAIHFFQENARVSQQAEALKHGDFAAFLKLVRESGRSSFQYLQNVYHGETQGLALALAESERVLSQTGACRVHGGGFAGTIQAFVGVDRLTEYAEAMDSLFGRGACQVLAIRPQGAIVIEKEDA